MNPSHPPDLCARCGHPTDPDALVCSACGAYLLVDLHVDEPVEDSRRRYHAAKAIAARGRPFPDLTRASQALQVRGSLLVPGMSRAAAAASAETLTALGVRTRITLAVPVDSADPADSPAGAHVPQGSTFRFDRIFPWLLLTLGALAAAVWILRAVLPPTGKAAGPLASGPTTGTAAALPRAVREPHEAVNHALEATAMLSCGDMAASGFFIAPDLLVTNHHATCGEIRIATRKGRTLLGRVIRSDEWLDLALVRVMGAGADPLALGDSTTLAVGDRVLAIGNPLGLEFTVTQGIVSHNAREVLGVGYLQFDGNVNPGNSGGPLIDQDGNVVGVVAMMLRNSRGLSFAIPVNYLYEGPQPLLRELSVKKNPEKWGQFLARVRTEESRELSELESAFRQPGLAGAGMDPGGITAVIVRRSGSEPNSEVLSFHVLEDGATLCSPAGVVERWKPIGSGPLRGIGDGRYVQWMQRNGLSAEFWVSGIRISGRGCPEARPSSNLELVLEGADPRADRAVLRGPASGS